MKYSVIIPVYNVEKYINRCVKSILSQRYNDLEIILIDNGSTDRSGSICDIYADDYANISVYHIENQGVASARNFGLSKARGEFIYFVDSDDYLVGNLFAEFEDKLAPDLDLLVFSYYNSFEQEMTERNRTKKVFLIVGYMIKMILSRYLQTYFYRICFILCGISFIGENFLLIIIFLLRSMS